MSAVREDIRDFLRREPAAILVEVTGAAGSTPRDTDAWMLVSERAIFATIGGGQLEYMAIDQARRAIRSGLSAEPMTVPLGPEIGQCCGGRVGLCGLQQLGEVARLAGGGRRLGGLRRACERGGGGEGLDLHHGWNLLQGVRKFLA